MLLARLLATDCQALDICGCSATKMSPVASRSSGVLRCESELKRRHAVESSAMLLYGSTKAAIRLLV